MTKFFPQAGLALAFTLAMGGVAFAQATATATTELNIRSGPGPEYPAVGFIDAGGTATVEGCMAGSKWCRVAYGNVTGWSYSDYLTAPVSGQAVVLTDRYTEVGLPSVTYDAQVSAGGVAGGAAGGVTGAVIGGVLGGPIGAVIGGAIGGSAGASVGASIDPPETARTYVRSNPVDPVYLDGEVVIGASLPATVTLRPIPDYTYQYVYVNGQAVLVEPQSRQIVYIVR